MKFTHSTQDNIFFHSFLPTESLSQPAFLDALSQAVAWDDMIGYAGYKSKDVFLQTVRGFIFGEDASSLPVLDLLLDTIQQTLLDAIHQSRKVLPLEGLHVFLFPTVKPFMIEKLNGVCGFSPWKHTIFLFLHPHTDLTRALQETISHEYNHTIAHQYHSWSTLLDSLIFEGLAEHFREHIFPGEHSPWVAALSSEECVRAFTRLQDKLLSADFQLYLRVFFGSQDYILWTGYSLGYQIVHQFFAKHPDLQWNEVMQLTPQEILTMSKYASRSNA